MKMARQVLIGNRMQANTLIGEIALGGTVHATAVHSVARLTTRPSGVGVQNPSSILNLKISVG